MATVKKYDTDVTINVQAAAAVTEGLLYGIDTNGKAVVADRTTGPQRASGFAVRGLTTAEATAGKAVALCSRGIVQLAAADIAGGAFTVGADVWLDVTGEYTTTKPTTATQLLQYVGVALTTTKVAVNLAHALVLTAANAGNIS